MDGLEILESLRSLGVTVEAVGRGKLRLEPASKIPAEMVPRIREVKTAILEALRNRPATCSPDCYEVQLGVRIHRPPAGCITIRPEARAAQHKVVVTCWHCRGEKRCTCIACWQTGQCVTCKGTGQTWRWIQ
jgi:hypothetical protein